MTPLEKEIYEKARKLKDLEKEYLRITFESNKPSTKEEVFEYGKKLWLIGSEAFDIRNEIVECFIDNLNIQVFDDNVKEILTKIRENEQFKCISFYEVYSKSVEENSGTSFNFAIDFEQFLQAKYDEWYDDFYQRFHPLRYHHEIMTIGPIISSSKIPSKALKYFDEIREAYSLELYLSAIALCRAVMEMCLFDKLYKKLPKEKSTKLDEDRLQRLAIKARKENLLNSKAKELADKIRESANKILHDKKSINQVSNKTKRDTFEIITSTIKVLEALYS